MNSDLYFGDCMEMMQKIEDNSIDLILADLPYGTTDRNGKGGSRIFKWDSVIPLEPLWKEYKRILKRNGTVVLTADQPFTSQLVMSNLDWFKYEFIWKKSRTTGFFTANYRPMKCTEDILVFSEGGAAAASAKSDRGNMTYNPQGLIEKRVKKKNSRKRLGKLLGNEDFVGKNNKMLGNSEYEQKWTNYPTEILEFPIETGTTHPTQKPVPLFEYLVKTYSNEGETVLDNVMGSGTTGIASLNSGRNFIGIEKDENFFKLSLDRIKKNVILNYTLKVFQGGQHEEQQITYKQMP
jgi:site-specific DNA-methyltransferase (adenine-specific)